MKKSILAGVLLSIIFQISQNCFADMINLTGAQLSPHVAEYYIDENRLMLKLEIGEMDKNFFNDLINGDEIQKKEFLSKRLFIKNERGNILNGNITLIENRKRTVRPSPINNPPGGRQPSENVTYVEIEYPFTKNPQSLIFNPPLNDNGAAAVTYGFIVYHDDIPVIDFRFLPYNQKLNLDWSDPWYSKFENKNLKRHHSSSLMSFLYVEPYEVRHEILVRLKDLEEWVNLDIEGKKYLSVDEQDKLLTRISDFIVTKNKLSIDGVAQNPIVERIQFVKVNLLGIQYYNAQQEIDTVSAVVGIILVYLTNGMPDKVTVEWDMFSDITNNIPVLKSDPAGPFPDFITPEYSTLVWENYLKNYELPQVSAVVVEKPLLSRKITFLISLLSSIVLCILILSVLKFKQGRFPGRNYIFSIFISLSLFVFILLSFLVPRYEFYQAEKHEGIVSSLLKNVYRSFDFKNESDIYDKLSTSIDGDLLRQIYLEIRKNLQYENTGGAKAKIQGIELENLSPKQLGNGNGYEYDTNWTVEGNVEHWGHIHNRTNRYNALITVNNIDGIWKITKFQLNDEQRVMPQ